MDWGISQERKELIDAWFNVDVKPRKATFDKLQTSEELHYLVINYNRDNGFELLKWVVESPLCSQATALKVFWESTPEFYLQYGWNTKKIIGDGDIEEFNLIRIIIKRFTNGFYAKASISYDLSLPDREIPDFMFQKTHGEETYIYYDERDADKLFGEYLENQLNRCSDTMELFNIVSVGNYIREEEYRKILNHPNCDKAIALMIYWRTQIILVFDELRNEIVSKIKDNYYPEVLSYNPKEDDKVDMDSTVDGREKHAKWKIPESMKKRIN